MTRVSLVYDGECPICTRYRDYVVLRQNFDVELIDAREAPGLVATLAAEGIDVNRGMVLTVDGVRFHGRRAVAMLDRLAAPRTRRDRAFRALVRIPGFLHVAYPLAKATRIVLLRLSGKSTTIAAEPSHDHKHPGEP